MEGTLSIDLFEDDGTWYAKFGESTGYGDSPEEAMEMLLTDLRNKGMF